MTDALVVQALANIAAELRALRSDLARAGVVQPREDGGELVDAIGNAVGGRDFTAAELIGFAEAADGYLLSLLSAGLGAKPTSRGVGKLLSRLARKPSCGLEVRRLGEDRNGILWTVKPAGLG